MAEIPRDEFSRSIILASVDILARISLKCHEEIGRLGHVGRECYEDATRKLFQWNLSLCKRGSHVTGTDIQKASAIKTPVGSGK